MADYFVPGRNGSLIYFQDDFSDVSIVDGSPFGTITRSAAYPPYALEASHKFGNFTLQYHTGNDTHRKADIVDGAMRFWLQSANAQSAARIQYNLYDNVGIRRIRSRFQMKLGAGMANLFTYGGNITWCTWAEFWNNKNWDSATYPFRITLSIHRTNGESIFRFRVQTETYNGAAWVGVTDTINTSFSVPVNDWMGMEYEIIEGNASTGKIIVHCTHGGVRHQIFNLTQFTHHPSDPAPDGFTDFNPLKLYTNPLYVTHVANAGGVMELLFKNLSIESSNDQIKRLSKHLSKLTSRRP